LICFGGNEHKRLASAFVPLRRDYGATGFGVWRLKNMFRMKQTK
jgi:hypothetical protein